MEPNKKRMVILITFNKDLPKEMEKCLDIVAPYLHFSSYKPDDFKTEKNLEEIIKIHPKTIIIDASIGQFDLIKKIVVDMIHEHDLKTEIGLLNSNSVSSKQKSGTKLFQSPQDAAMIISSS